MKIGLETAFVNLIAVTPMPERVISDAACVCYRSEKKKAPNLFIKSLIAKGHESVLEHASATVEIVCSRACLAQLTRHRLASFSVESTRYVDLVAKTGVLNLIWAGGDPSAEDVESLERSVRAYQSAVGRLGRENARKLLPMCVATRLIMTANFREWRTIMKQRITKEAEIEVRFVVDDVRSLLMKVAPSCFADMPRALHV